MHPGAQTIRLIAAFAAVYIVWGSTYLAMKVAVASLPPFVLGAIRFIIAGSLLLLLLALFGRVRPEWLRNVRFWRSACLTGGLMLVAANSLLAYSLRVIPSGTAALVVAFTPVWIVLFDRLQLKRGRPPGRILLGLALGSTGVGVLAGFGEDQLRPTLRESAGIGMAVLSTLCWALGSILGRRTQQPRSLMVGAAMQMIAGGAMMTLLAIITAPWVPVDWRDMGWREWWNAAWAPVSWRAWTAVAYLAVAGSMIGFSAYVWLLQNTSAARAATYAYVNPLVAIAIGWIMLEERLTPRLLAAVPLILLGVVLLQWPGREPAMVVAREPVGPEPGAAALTPKSTSHPDGAR